MLQVKFLQRYRMEKLLKTGAATIYLAMVHPDLLGVDDLREKYPRVMMLHVGRGLARPAPCYLYDHCLVVDGLSFGGIARQIVIPWQALLRSDPLVPPSDGGTRLVRAA